MRKVCQSRSAKRKRYKNFEEEQTYLTTETQERELSTWRALLQDGEFTQSHVDKMKTEPWFAAEIQEFRDHAEVHKDFLELIKTPKRAEG
jgi:hypothetical protein